MSGKLDKNWCYTDLGLLLWIPDFFAHGMEERLLDKIRKLSSDKIIEVEDFIDFLYKRQTDAEQNLTIPTTRISEASFSKVWDNPEAVEYDNL